MRDRFSNLGDARISAGAKQRRLRADLERRGLASELVQPLATRLAPLLDSVSTRAYGAALDAATAAAEVAREGVGAESAPASGEADRAGDVAEIQRLMLGFTDELRKLEEGLRILSAFVVRMRTRAGFDTDGVLH
jgi:hypothetical protein